MCKHAQSPVGLSRSKADHASSPMRRFSEAVLVSGVGLSHPPCCFPPEHPAMDGTWLAVLGVDVLLATSSQDEVDPGFPKNRYRRRE